MLNQMPWMWRKKNVTSAYNLNSIESYSYKSTSTACTVLICYIFFFKMHIMMYFCFAYSRFLSQHSSKKKIAKHKQSIEFGAVSITFAVHRTVLLLVAQCLMSSIAMTGGGREREACGKLKTRRGRHNRILVEQICLAVLICALQ